MEELAQCGDGACAMRRAQRSQLDVQLGLRDAEGTRGGEDLAQERAAVLVGACVVGPQQSEQIVTRRSPTASRTSRSTLGNALVNAALTSPVMTSSGSPD